MPATKTPFTIFSAQSLTGGGGPTQSSWVDLREAYGAIWYVTITNGINRLSQGVEVQAEIAKNQTAGNEHPWDCRKIGKQEKDAVTKFVIRIPPEADFSRLDVQHGDADATIDASCVALTGL